MWFGTLPTTEEFFRTIQAHPNAHVYASQLAVFAMCADYYWDSLMTLNSWSTASSSGATYSLAGRPLHSDRHLNQDERERGLTLALLEIPA